MIYNKKKYVDIIVLEIFIKLLGYWEIFVVYNISRILLFKEKRLWEFLW